MKNFSEFTHSRRFRHGGSSLALTCVVVAAVILFNALFTAFGDKYLWYTDMTVEGTYTLSESVINVLSEPMNELELKDENKVKLIFCDDRDNIESNELQNYVLKTAEGISNAFPDKIEVEFVNIRRNPSAVSYYKTNSKSNIYSSSVIVAYGTEFRIQGLRSFYTFNETTDTSPNGYNGEKKMTAALLSVMQAYSPAACVTYNHGEPFVTEADQAENEYIITLLQDAGYEVRLIDLAREEIPEDCRLILVYDPQSDFVTADGVSEISEIAKLEKFLAEANSLMVFTDPTTPALPVLEEYLEEWGISYERAETELGEVSCMVKDDSNSLTTDGMTIIGSYVTSGAGASFTKDLRTTFPPKVIFKNAMPIKYTYDITTHKDEEDSSNNYQYGTYYSNGASRSIYDVFDAALGAYTVAGDEEVRTATKAEPIRLMTITSHLINTVENRPIDETSNETEYAYVLACGSTEFLSRTMLTSAAYGNTDVMLTALRGMGRELVPVSSIKFKYFASSEIETMTTEAATQYTVVLTVIPPVIAFVVGLVVLIRRKYA